jgi:hypothetical protein
LHAGFSALHFGLGRSRGCWHEVRQDHLKQEGAFMKVAPLECRARFRARKARIITLRVEAPSGNARR